MADEVQSFEWDGMGETQANKYTLYSSKGKAYKKIKIKDDFHKHFPQLLL